MWGHQTMWGINRRNLWRSETGSITILILLLIPAIIFVGGFATDIALINAQKRYTQSQADLAASSAARYLPDLTRARSIAQKVVSANTVYGNIQLASTDVLFGSTATGTFVAAANQSSASGVNAIQVTVSSPYHPLLLSAFMGNTSRYIPRSAVAKQRAALSFTLRNALLGLDTNQSILNALLNNLLGLGVTASVLSYQGLATTQVSINQLLGLLSAGVGANVLTYSDILNANVSTSLLVNVLKSLGALPSSVSSTSSQSLTLGSLLSISPTATTATIGQVLPDLKVNVFDLVMAAVSLNGSGSGSPLIQVPLGISLGQLLNVAVSVSLVQPAVIAAGFIDDVPPVSAAISQAKVAVSANVSTLLKLDVGVNGGNATATATSLNCGAKANSDTLATFAVTTSAVTLSLKLALLQLINGHDNANSTTIPAIFGGSQTVTVRLDQLGVAQTIGNPVQLSSVTSALSGVLSNVNAATTTDKANCGLLGLGCVLSAVTNVLNGLSSLLVSTSALNNIVGNILDLLGIDVAQAQLILNDYSCSSALVQ